jgi:HAD superfamily hydrolase (TIGR01549 family)
VKSYAAYLFDADGTLIDTTELICRCFYHTCKVFGDVPIDREKILSNIGMTLRAQMEVYFGTLTDDQFAERSAEHMRFQLSIYKEYLRSFPTVIEGLKCLAACGKRMAIVTSRRRETLDIYLKHTGMFDFFEVMITPKDTAVHKPEPEPALAAMRMLDMSDPSAVLFIGDARFDIECGARAGTDTAFVSWSSNPVSSCAIRPTYIIDDLTQLCSFDE